MLFGPCVQDVGATFLSGIGPLCGGGAGFVSALIGALIGSSRRTARAQPLGRAVPEVDRLAVRIVTDNTVIQFVPDREARRPDHRARERQPVTGSAAAHRPDGEWGLAMHAKSNAATRRATC